MARVDEETPRAELLGSEKDLREHEYSVRSVVDALAQDCTELVLEVTDVLTLRNVLHLVTDVCARVSRGSRRLRAAGSRPSVSGRVRRATRGAAARHSRDRGTCAWPLRGTRGLGGMQWQGEVGIALRCGDISEDRGEVRLIGGGGIIARSRPESELAESEAKLRAMLERTRGSSDQSPAHFVRRAWRIPHAVPSFARTRENSGASDVSVNCQREPSCGTGAGMAAAR